MLRRSFEGLSALIGLRHPAVRAVGERYAATLEAGGDAERAAALRERLR